MMSERESTADVNPEPRRASRWPGAARLVVTLSLIGALLYYVDWRHSLRLCLEADIRLLALSLLLFPYAVYISALKWDVLVRAHGIHLPIYTLFRAYWIGVFASNFLPSMVGGDVARILLLRGTKRLAELAASVFIERVTGGLVLVALCAVSLWATPELFEALGVSTLFRLVIAVIIAGTLILAIFGERLTTVILTVKRLAPNWMSGLFDKCMKLARAVWYYRARTKELLLSGVYSVLFYAAPFALHYLLFKATDAPIGVVDVLLLSPWAMLIGLLPISINGLGVVEGTLVLLYTAVGATREQAFAVAILGRFLQTLMSLPGGLMWLRWKDTAEAPVPVEPSS